MVREIVCSNFAVAVAKRPHRVAILKDVTLLRTEARTAVALAQTAAQLAGAGTTEEILVGVARHGVEGTRAGMGHQRQRGVAEVTSRCPAHAGTSSGWLP
ncbi:MAG: hypothetical protein ACLQVK_09245 [Acidimicrobiales bacterium]